MTLTSGTHLGSYEILEPLGRGGMGEVYRARDTKLGREVALKILPDSFALDPERRQRFEREAQLLAALNHPHIGALYGLEDSGAVHALVLELVEGPTLADRLTSGPLPIPEALAIAHQIADALDAAHEKGIVHRDLKPANIMLKGAWGPTSTRSKPYSLLAGTPPPRGPQALPGADSPPPLGDVDVKVLDFGLARMSVDEAAPVNLTNSPTMTGGPTGAGTLLGTAPYMSPEQARGFAVDKRSDVWAFGCVLYELLTGRRAFPGATMSDTLAAILDREPDWAALPPATPVAVRRLLQRCLVKDSKRRLRDIADARLEIEDARTASTADAATRQPAEANRHTLRWIAALLVSIVVTGVVAWMLRPRLAPLAQPSASLARVVIAPAAPLPVDVEGLLALSPDGRRLAYVGGPAGNRHLYLRDVDQFESKLIPGTEGATSPVFSPDGQWLAFAADRKLKKVALAGGAPLTLCELGAGPGLSWGADAIFFAGGGKGIWRVSSEGGVPIPVTKIRERENGHDFPSVLPDGRAVLFSSNTEAGFQVNVQSLETGVRHLLGRGIGAHYLPTGHVVYADNGTLFAVPFDPVRLEAKGPPVFLLDGIAQSSNRAPQVSFSRTGSMVFVPGAGEQRPDRLMWVARSGTEQPTDASASDYQIPRLAPDGRRVVVTAGRGTSTGSDLWLYDLIRGTSSRLTFDGSSGYPAWTPDGRQLAFITAKDGQEDIYIKSLDGGGVDERFFTGGTGTNRPFSWSPDGQLLAFVSVSPATSNDIWVLDRRDRGKPRPFLQTSFREGAPVFSPDGRWMAYGSDKSGRDEIYLRPFPGPGEEWTVSTDGGKEPAWARQSGELFYRHGDGMFAVDVMTTGTLAVGKPRLLFNDTYAPSRAFFANYDVTPDGQRFLMIKRGDRASVPTQINLVLNWFDELSRLAPVRRP